MLEESELFGLTETGDIEGFGFGNGDDGEGAFGDLADLPAPGDGDESKSLKRSGAGVGLRPMPVPFSRVAGWSHEDDCRRPVLSLALAAPAAFASDFLQMRTPHCTYSVPKKMRLKPVLVEGNSRRRHVRRSSTEASSIALIESRKQNDKEVGPSTTTASRISNSDVLTFTEAGTQSLRVNILQEVFRRYAKTKFRVLPGVKRDPERPYHTSVDSGKVITVVR